MAKPAKSEPEKPVVSGLVPYLVIDGANDAAELYKKAFGATEAGRMPNDESGRTMHIHLRINGSSLMLSDAYPESGYPHEEPRGYSLALMVDDIDAWWKRATEAGLTVVTPVDKMFWGDRYGQVRDRYGVRWDLNEPGKDATQ